MGIVIGIMVFLALFGGSKETKLKCQVCVWRGSKKLWDSHKGCPNCKTDERPVVYSK